MRLARGSGLTGLAGMQRQTPLNGCILVRPLLSVSKARLLATLGRAGLSFCDDPSNRDPRFTRVRLRALAPVLAREGLDAERLARLASRLGRADAALDAVLDAALAAPQPWPAGEPVELRRTDFAAWPAELRLRAIGRAVGRTGDEGAVELAKLEALVGALDQALGVPGEGRRFRRTLAGAMVTLTADKVRVERAPARRTRSASART
jgi:tRNA(Ile)-lysidine synthase